MRKIIALVVGLLMLGGMMGMVSAHQVTVDGESTDWNIDPETIHEESSTYQNDVWVWHDSESDVSDSAANVKVLAITADGNNVYFLINTSDVANLRMLIVIDADNNADTGKKDFVFQTLYGEQNLAWGNDLQSTRGYEVTLRIEPSASDIAILKGDGTTEDLSSVGGTYATGNVLEIKVPRSVFENYGSTWAVSFVTADSSGTAVEASLQDTMDYLSYSGGTYYITHFETVDMSQVPFFSNAGIAAAVTLLLVLGAVWFFRRQ